MTVDRVIILQTAFLGDILLTAPLLKALPQVFPHASRELVTTPVGEAALAGIGLVDNIHVFDKRGAHRSLSATRTFAKALSTSASTVVLVPHRSIRTAFMLSCMPSVASVTWRTAASRWLASTVLPYPWALHEADRNLALLKPWIGSLPTKETIGPIPLANPQLTPRIDQILSTIQHPFVVLAPGSAWATKQLPNERAVAIANAVSERFGTVVVIGDTHSFHWGSNPNIVDLCGATTIQEAAAVIARAQAVISVDSAPLHMASLQGVPAIGIFGPTVPEFGFGPWGVSAQVVQSSSLLCRPCSPHGAHQCPLAHHQCMRSISHQAVADFLSNIVTKSYA